MQITRVTTIREYNNYTRKSQGKLQVHSKMIIEENNKYIYNYTLKCLQKEITRIFTIKL